MQSMVSQALLSHKFDTVIFALFSEIQKALEFLMSNISGKSAQNKPEIKSQKLRYFIANK